MQNLGHAQVTLNSVALWAPFVNSSQSYWILVKLSGRVAPCYSEHTMLTGDFAKILLSGAALAVLFAVGTYLSGVTDADTPDPARTADTRRVDSPNATSTTSPESSPATTSTSSTDIAQQSDKDAKYRKDASTEQPASEAATTPSAPELENTQTQPQQSPPQPQEQDASQQQNRTVLRIATTTQRQDFGAVNDATRGALVNVLCRAREVSPVRGVTGSGVIIHPSGIVMTNAHIAQHLLLANYPEENAIQCEARRGNPARESFGVELLYISPSWINANANQIAERTPTGTGRYDFALLRLTNPKDENRTRPAAFPHLALPRQLTAAALMPRLLVAGYPTGLIGERAVSDTLYSSSSVVDVRERFTFSTSTVDLLSLGGSVVAQKGASGGPAVTGDRELAGLIVTSTLSPNTGDRNLRAITTAHINRTILTETGRPLGAYLATSSATIADRFQEQVAPRLQIQLIEAIEMQ